MPCAQLIPDSQKKNFMHLFGYKKKKLYQGFVGNNFKSRTQTMSAIGNRLVLLVLAFAMCPSWLIIAANGNVFPVFIKWHVNIVNGLNNNMTLFTHCKSSDNDLGYQIVSPAANFSWSFRTNFFHSTLFWCYTRKDNAHATFKVFWQDPLLFEHCKWKNCIWIVRDDGIYIRDLEKEQDEFRYQWGADTEKEFLNDQALDVPYS
jgi:hypothetical protein